MVFWPEVNSLHTIPYVSWTYCAGVKLFLFLKFWMVCTPSLFSPLWCNLQNKMHTEPLTSKIIPSLYCWWRNLAQSLPSLRCSSICTHTFAGNQPPKQPSRLAGRTLTATQVTPRPFPAKFDSPPEGAADWRTTENCGVAACQKANAAKEMGDFGNTKSRV